MAGGQRRKEKNKMAIRMTPGGGQSYSSYDPFAQPPPNASEIPSNWYVPKSGSVLGSNTSNNVSSIPQPAPQPQNTGTNEGSGTPSIDYGSYFAELDRQLGILYNRWPPVKRVYSLNTKPD